MCKKTKILYVDDESVNLRLFNLMVKDETTEIILACDAYEAMDILDTKAVDILFSDCNMPGIDGMELIRKTKEKHGHMKCYLLTGINMNGKIQQAIDSKQLDGYLQKPFNKETILEAIGNALKEI